MEGTSKRGLDRALATILRVGVTTIAAMSGAVTVAYVVGYMNRKMYLSVFGAGWILPELPTAEVLIAGSPAIGILVVSLGLGFQGVTTQRPPWTRSGIVNFAYVLGAAELLFDHFFGSHLLHETRAFLHGGIGGTLTFIAVTLARGGFVSLSDSSVESRYSAVNKFALAAIAGLVLMPISLGIAEAHGVCGNELKDLPRVAVQRRSVRLSLLAISNERVYCLERATGDDIKVVPVPWEHVVAIIGKRQ